LLKTRIIAALIFAPALLGLVFWGGLPLAIACLLIALLMLWEYLQLTLGPGHVYIKAVAFLLTAAVAVQTLELLPPVAAGLMIPAGAMLTFIAVLAKPTPLDGALHRVAVVAFGVAYCGALIPYLSRLRDLEQGLGLALMAVGCTWLADTGAYFAGRFLGRHKLYPAVSPKKTIEGGVGGAIASILIAVLIRALFALELSLLHAVVVGALAAVFGILGDLCESMLKRSVGAKDSGKLIPGHGGVLDRFDAMMFVVPAVFVYATVAIPF
jgi:phosphatidate cytidylyltransferase